MCIYIQHVGTEFSHICSSFDLDSRQLVSVAKPCCSEEKTEEKKIVCKSVQGFFSHRGEVCHKNFLIHYISAFSACM